MSGNISFNPFLTSNAQGSFSTLSEGYVQGALQDDPSARNYLTTGYLAPTETLPMWGGVAIYEYTAPNTGYPASYGPAVGRALTTAAITGFSTINQATAWITSAQSQSPTAAVGMTVPFVRLGSNNRLAVAIDPALVSLDGGLVTQQVSWDFNLQRLIPYYPTTAAITISTMTAAVASGVVTVSVTTASAHNLSVGSDFTISGAVPTAYNGSWTVLTTSTTTTLTFILTGYSTSPGSVTTTGQINAGGGALPVKILETQIGNSLTVTYNATTNYANWNQAGSTAIILI
jgi:hypothetical protein